MRTLNREECFAVLIINKIDYCPLFDAMMAVIGREPTKEELESFLETIFNMRKGWPMF